MSPKISKTFPLLVVILVMLAGCSALGVVPVNEPPDPGTVHTQVAADLAERMTATAQAQPKETAASAPVVTDPGDWPVFIDPENGCQLSYPSDWAYREIPVNQPGGPPSGDLVRLLVFGPQALMASLDQPPAPDQAPAVPPLMLEITRGSLDDYRLTHPQPVRSENLVFNGLPVVHEDGGNGPQWYVFQSPTDPDLRLTLVDQVSGFPQRSGQYPGLAELLQKILSSVLFLAPAPSQTAEPSPTPVVTQAPVASTPASTPRPTPCNWAQFISDVTVPDGSLLTVGEDFTKTWRLKNIGTCTWSTDYELVLVDGERFGAPYVVPLPEEVQPGETIDLSLELEAPQQTGEYQTDWQLRSPDGEYFGLGKNANQPFWLQVRVVTANASYAYDFAFHYCDAQWRSAGGYLACPSAAGVGGSINLLQDALLENRLENELTLWVRPNEAPAGYIEGLYPARTIQDGDRFKAWVGCMEGAEECSLTFSLQYLAEDGSLHTLGEWVELYDGQVHNISLDLSEFAGQRIRLILRTEINNTSYDAAQGFWFVPRIEHDN
ncbi:MAG: hypothetical protein JW862_10835 [Anaerolineales bacterium]|nr:hypothetical protein [Anaerolineales bacterium]